MISRQIFGIRMVFRETFFVSPPASSSSPYPGGFNPSISNVTEDTSPHVTSETQIPDTALDPRCQSASIKRSVWSSQRRQFLSRKTDRLIYEYFRVTGANDSVENYADLFTVVLRSDDIQEFDSKWDEILLSMSSKTAPGSLSTGSPASRTPPHGDGSMYSQANVRVESVLRPLIRALPSVFVDTEKVLREADGSEEM